MPTDPSPPPPRRKPSALWWIAAAFALLVGLFLYQLFGPNRPIIVSKQTTYITEPLLPNGLPDYRQYLLDRQRAGVTPENNAAVLMWQAMGPGSGSDAIKPADWKLLAVELQLPPHDPAIYVTPLYSQQNRDAVLRWVEQNAPQPKDAPSEDPEVLAQMGMTQQDFDADEIISAAMDAPWRAEQLPPMAEWVAANQAPLDLLVEASARSRFYSPPIEMLKSNDDGMSLMSVSLHSIQTIREIARMLKLRAMLRFGEGQPELAWQDLLATHRWARHVSQGPTIVEQLVAMAVEGIAGHGTTALLGNERLSPELARQIQQDLATLGSATRVAESFDTGERIFGLSTICAVSQGGLGALIYYMDPNGDRPSSHPFDFVSLDWNAPLIACNRIYDQLAAASRIVDYQAREKALQNILRDVQQMDSEFQSPANWAASAISPARRAKLLAAAVVTMLAPALDAYVRADDRSRAQSELLQIAAALAVYRADKGDFPDSLDALVPDYLPQPSVDFFNAKPFVYQRNNGGYLLYTLGENGTDDGGSNEMMTIVAGESVDDLPHNQQEAAAAKILAGADDFSIHVPILPFSLPAPPPANPKSGE